MQESKFNFLYPAYLWFGQTEHLNIQVNQFLKQIYCKENIKNTKNSTLNNNFCDVCIKCIQVDKKQHANIRFIEPEGNYILSDLKIIFSTISYSLSDEEHFFFILYKADTLSTFCANSLLKSLEEPPAGYHFILLAQRKEGILPTILSRCIVKNFITNITENNKLVSLLTNPSVNNAQEFDQELSLQKLVERDVMIIIDELEKYWLNNYKKNITNISNDIGVRFQEQNIIKHNLVIELLQKFREFPPMPGSSKIALKNLYLNLLNILN